MQKKYVFPVNNLENREVIQEELQKAERFNCSKTFIRPSTEKFPASQTL